MAWHQLTRRADEEALLRQYAPLAQRAAAALARRTRGKVQYGAAWSGAMLGLLEAIRSHDPAKGASLVTHAMNRIRVRMLDHLRADGSMIRGDQSKPFMLSIDHHHRSPRRHGWKNRRDEDCAAGRTLSQTLTYPREGPTAKLEREEEVARLLRMLRPRERLILTRYFLEERTMAQIGEEIGVTESYVSQQIKAIIAYLRSTAAA